MKGAVLGFALGLLIGYAAHRPKIKTVTVQHEPNLADCEDVRAAIPPGVAVMRGTDGNLTWVDLRPTPSPPSTGIRP
jgi:hypothetical protein